MTRGLLGHATIAEARLTHATNPRARPQAVQQLIDQLGRDVQRSGNDAFRSLFLLDTAQVLDRLGTPSEVRVESDSRWSWNYVQADRVLVLTFCQGVVIRVRG